MAESQKRSGAMNEIIKDATTAAVQLLAEKLSEFPEKEHIAPILTVVVHDAIKCAVILDRLGRLTPSAN
jgi:hypothetical protein